MGQVFTWDALAKGRVPTPDDIGAVWRILKDRVAREDAVTDVLVFGSVVRGDYGVRSDIDVMLAYPRERARLVKAMADEMCAVAAKRNVPISFAPCRLTVAKTHMHHFGPSFMGHLAQCLSKGLVKGGFDIFVDSITNAAETESYLRHKLHKLESKWFAYEGLQESEKVRFLQKVLEAPAHVARRVLARKEILKCDSKEEVFQAYASHMPRPLPHMLAEAIGLDREYSAEVCRQLIKPSESDYRTFLEYLEEQVPGIIDFVEANVLLVADLARR